MLELFVSYRKSSSAELVERYSGHQTKMMGACMATMVPPSPTIGFVHLQSQGNWICVYDSRRRIATSFERKRSVLLLATTLDPEAVETRMPAWHDIPLRGVLDRLEGELTRKPFSDEAWETSAELLTTVCVELGGCHAPFSDEPSLPMPHAAAMSFVDRLNERCRRADIGEAQKAGVPIGLHSSLKFSIKKNGVTRVMADVGEGFSPTFRSSRDRLVTIKGVERCLAEFCVIWSTARLLEACAPSETKRDFVFHLKAILEHAPARDRLAAVLVLCRGLFTPGHNDAASRVHDNVHGAALRQHAGGSSLVDSFGQVQKQTANHPAGLRAARQAFPFLEMLARWAWRCHTPDPIKSTTSTKAFGKKLEENKSSSFKKIDLEATNDVGLNSRDNGKEGGILEEEKTCRRSRGREDTGVASLLVAIAEDDPLGETIRCLQRWACDAILLEEVSESSQFAAFNGRNEVARAVISTHEIFVSGRKSNRQRWMRACREVGEIVRLLVLANDGSREGEQETYVKSMVNHAMFVTTFLRSLPQGVAARKGYEQVVAAGHVPGDTKGMATNAALPRAKTWKEAVGMLDLGISSLLGVHEDTVRSDAYRRSLSALMTSWESPYALADYYVMHRKHREVAREYLRFLRAVLDVSGETVCDIRVNDPCNQEHMRHFPESVRRLWEAEPSTLPGTTDPRIIFRMGEDTRSCMGIRRSCKSQNRALLGYLLQGNVRLVGLQSPSGRMEARAVIRLLLRSDNMTPALLMDSVYYSSNPDPVLEQQVLAEAWRVSDALDGVPLFRAGDKVPVDASLPKEDCHETSMSGLVEMDGLSTWVYSEWAMGLLERDSHPGASRRIVVTELEYDC